MPTGQGQKRDNAEELRLKAALERERPIEPDLTRWLGLFDAPLDSPPGGGTHRHASGTIRSHTRQGFDATLGSGWRRGVAPGPAEGDVSRRDVAALGGARRADAWPCVPRKAGARLGDCRVRTRVLPLAR